MENIDRILKKKETESMDISELLMKHPELFQPIGKAVSISEHDTTYENENMKVSFSYEPVMEDKFLESISPEMRYLFSDEDHKFDLNEYFKITKFSLVSGDATYELDQEENKPTIIFKKNQQIDNIEGTAHTNLNLIEINSAPSSPQAILTLMHELGHMKDEKIKEDDIRSEDLRFKAIMAGSYNDKIDNELNAIVLRQERFAWAKALVKLKPFIDKLGVSRESIDKLIHDFALGGHCKAMPETESEKLAA